MLPDFLKTAPQISRHHTRQQKITAAVVMMGSNEAPERNMTAAMTMMAAWGELGEFVRLASAVSPDHTGRSPAEYHNQGLCLYFLTAIDYMALYDKLKNIERLCGRDERKNSAEHGYLVALDLDILAVQMDGVWQVIAEHLPLKAHELRCLGGV